jgi:hypothetical protein
MHAYMACLSKRCQMPPAKIKTSCVALERPGWVFRRER